MEVSFFVKNGKQQNNIVMNYASQHLDQTMEKLEEDRGRKSEV